MTNSRTTSGGLFVRQFEIDSPLAHVKIVHGIAEHSGRYVHVADAFNKAGFSVEVLDSRGHGSSPGFPGDVGDSVEALIAETEEFISHGAKSFVFGHSAGTLSVIPAVARLGSTRVCGLIVSGIAVEPGMAMLTSLMEGGPIPPEKISRDSQVVADYIADPLVFYDKVPMETIGLAAEAIALTNDALAKIDVPVLIIHGGDDEICSPNGAQIALDTLAATDKTLTVYPGLYHEVLNEPEKEKVIADIVEWITARISG